MPIPWWDVGFWQEFIRVEWGRLLLFVLVIMFYVRDTQSGLNLVLGALIGSIKENRYRDRWK